MDEPEAAWERALLILEAHAKISNSEHHPNDVPSAVIERLLIDLMHYCHERNKGVTVGSGEYVDMGQMVRFAREQFLREREAMPETHEPRLDPDHPKPDPELVALQTKLFRRQLAEREELERKHTTELARLGPSAQLSGQHVEELVKQADGFDKERERYTREYHEAKRLAREMEEREKERTADLAEGKKLSRST